MRGIGALLLWVLPACSSMEVAPVADGGLDAAQKDAADPCGGVVCRQPPSAKCSADRYLVTYARTGTCVAGRCVYGQTSINCADGCENGACRGPTCSTGDCSVAGATRCAAGQLHTCVSDGNGCLNFSAPVACPSGSCADDSSCGSCTHGCPSVGATACASGQLATCQADVNGCRAWSAPSWCASGFCASATACGVCTHGCPSVGATACASGQLATCQADVNGCRAWSAASPCASGFCASATSCGVCNHACPSVGATECASGQARICQADGNGCRSWGAASPCASGFCADALSCGCTWTSETVDPGSVDYWPPAVAVSGGKAHIVYSNRVFDGSSISREDLIHASRVPGAAWSFNTLDTAPRMRAEGPSLYAGPLGTLHLAYWRSGSDVSDTLRYATLVPGSTWKMKDALVINYAPSDVHIATPAVVADDKGAWHILYQRLGNATGAPVLAHLGSSSSSTFGCCDVSPAGAALDAAGKLHVAFVASGADVKYRYPSGAGWDGDLVSTDDAGYAAIAIAPSGRPLVAFNNQSGRLSLSTRDASQVWIRETVDNAGAFLVSARSLAVDRFGAIHVVYEASAGLTHATRAPGGAWSTALIEAGQHHTATLAVDGAGGLHVAYVIWDPMIKIYNLKYASCP